MVSILVIPQAHALPQCRHTFSVFTSSTAGSALIEKQVSAIEELPLAKEQPAAGGLAAAEVLSAAERAAAAESVADRLCHVSGCGIGSLARAPCVSSSRCSSEPSHTACRSLPLIILVSIATTGLTAKPDLAKLTEQSVHKSPPMLNFFLSSRRFTIEGVQGTAQVIAANSKTQQLVSHVEMCSWLLSGYISTHCAARPKRKHAQHHAVVWSIVSHL